MDFFPYLEKYLFFKIYFLIGGKLLYNIVLVSAVQCKSADMIIIYPSPREPPSPPPHPTPLDLHREPGWATCVIKQLPTNNPFYRWLCIYVNATFSICPTLSLPLIFNVVNIVTMFLKVQILKMGTTVISLALTQIPPKPGAKWLGSFNDRRKDIQLG